MTIKKYNGIPETNLNDDVVIIYDAKINDISTIKLYGKCKIIFIIDAYYGGNAKNIIKKMRKNDDCEEYDFMENEYNFDLTNILELEIVMDACDIMRHKYYVGVSINKCNNNVIYEVDKDGDRICEFVEELKNGIIETSVCQEDIDKIYEMFCE